LSHSKTKWLKNVVGCLSKEIVGKKRLLVAFKKNSKKVMVNEWMKLPSITHVFVKRRFKI